MFGIRLFCLVGAKHVDGVMGVWVLAEQETIPKTEYVKGFLAKWGIAESLKQNFGVPLTGGVLDTITCDDI